jgi:ribonuclease Z
VLYHEATFAESELARAKETYHSTARQAAGIARAARVKKLVIGHYSSRYSELGTLLKEAVAVFPDTELADEGKILSL